MAKPRDYPIAEVNFVGKPGDEVKIALRIIEILEKGKSDEQK